MGTPSSSKKLRILNLNTNLYYDQDKLTKGVVDPADQFRWLEDRLVDARKKNFSVSAFAVDTEQCHFTSNIYVIDVEITLY